MLIIQIALGIVLAVLILAYLPTLLSLGIAAILLLVGLGALGIALYFLYEYWLLALFVAISIGAYFLYERWLLRNPIHSIQGDLSSEIRRRRAALGYGNETSKGLVAGGTAESLAGTGVDREQEQRRSQGYSE